MGGREVTDIKSKEQTGGENQPYGEETVVSILQIRKWRLRNVKDLAQDQAWVRWGLNPYLFDFRAGVFCPKLLCN